MSPKNVSVVLTVNCLFNFNEITSAYLDAGNGSGSASVQAVKMVTVARVKAAWSFHSHFFDCTIFTSY